MPPRRLLLIRHAAAGDAPRDRERPLTEPGARAATAIGEWLRRAGFVPDRVLVSPAVRAAQTWERAATSLGGNVQPSVDERIYDNTVDSVLAAVREIPEDVEILAVVGHNPSIGRLAAMLDDGGGDPSARSRIDAGFPTGAVAVFTVGTTLDVLAPGDASLTHFAVPTA